MLKVGSIVISLRGHDTGRKYVVVKLDKEFAFVCDGKYRAVEKLKKKRIKHLEDTHKIYKGKVTNFEIVKALKKAVDKDKR